MGAAGCLNFDLDSQPYLILDYTIDKTRVVALRAQPPVVQAGRPTIIDALVLSPFTDDPQITGSVCGLRTDVEVDIDGVACFSNPDLVEQVVEVVPQTWTPPSLDGMLCDPLDVNVGEPCASEVPLLIEARTDLDVARASVGIGISRDLPSQTYPPIPIDLVEPAGPIRGGDEVVLIVESGRAPVALDHVAWWVDGGVLLGTGRTRTVGDEDEVTRNTLVVPQGWSGPLRVAAVAVESGLTPMSWDVITLEVE